MANLTVARSAGLCPDALDRVFGPAIPQPCRGGFDFTLMFEQSILSIAPAALLLLVAPIRLFHLHRASSAKALRQSRPDAAKMVVAVCSTALQTSLVALWAVYADRATSASLPSAVLSLACAALLCLLSHVEHIRAIRPSTVISLYLFFSILLDIPQARTLFLRGDLTPIAAVFVASMGARAAMLVLEGFSKRRLLAMPFRDYPIEALSGIFSRTFLWWLNPLFAKGAKGLFGIDDLFELDPALASRQLGELISAEWDGRVKPESSLTLVWTCIKTLWWPLLLVIPPRIALIGFNYAQPFLISRLISFLSEPRDGPESYNTSLGLIAAAAIIYLGIAIFTVRYMHQLYRFITMLRACLTRLIFTKTLELRHVNDSAAVTLMSTDVDRIAMSMQNMNEVWARTVEIALGVWLLAVQLGWVAVLPISLIAICAAANSYASRFISNKQKTWNAAVQKRIGVTASTLGSMKSVKMMGFSRIVTSLIQKLRIDELNSAMGYRWLVVLTNMIAYTPLIFGPVLTFIAFAAQSSNHLNINNAFTSLSLLTLITQPATQLLTAITESAACLGCFTRIQTFLLSDKFHDVRRHPRTHKDDAVDTVNSSAEVLVPSPVTSNQSNLKLHDLPTKKPSTDSAAGTFSIPGHIKHPASHAFESTGTGSRGISIQRCSIKPSESAPPAISNLTLEVEAGQIAIVTGPVGCGKTTLLNAILGELVPDSGSIYVGCPRIAYCAQTPWIMNISLLQTITGAAQHTAVDEAYYSKVIKALALEQDFAGLPSGDQSIPGSNGLTLSGGQKQRLALARALYSRLPIIVLDDVLSALDTKTEGHVVESLLGSQGLLRTSNSTVLIATHSQRANQYADHLVVLHKNGSVAAQGPPDQAIVDAAIKTEVASDESDATPGGVSKPTPAKKPVIRGPSANDTSDLSRRTGDLSTYAYYFKSVGLFAFLGFLLVTAIFVFASYFPQVWLQWWAADNGSHFAKYIGVYIALAVIAWFFRAVTLWWMLVYISPKSSASLHWTMLKTAMNAPMQFFASNDSGVTLNRFSQDIGLIDRALPLSLGRVLTQLCTILAQLALISLGSAYMAITIPFLLIAVYVLQKIYLLTSRQMRYLDLEGRSPVYTNFLETLAGVSTIRAFGWHSQFEKLNIRNLDHSQRPYYMLYCIQRWLNMVLDLIVAAMAVLVVTLAVRLPGNSSGASIGIALNNILGFSQALRVMVDAWTSLETSLGSIARLKSFEAIVVPEHGPNETLDPGNLWPNSGAIQVQGLSASYNDDTKVLQNVSFSLEPGQKLGICGRTGSGKSTLLLTLLRILDFDAGSIFIDGVDLAQVPRDLLRERLTTISQDAFILDDTVRHNLDPSGASSDAILSSALQKVQLWDVLSSRGGLDARIKQQPLSQGQQQLFALARALVRQGKVLILDEATSNVDAESDQLMQRVIREEFSGRTIITVAHRLDTILDADLVLVLDQGRVVELGKPAELLQTQGSRFAELRGSGDAHQ